jgi:hypothetical protein
MAADSLRSLQQPARGYGGDRGNTHYAPLDVIPARTALRQFNEIAVLFHFSLIRRGRSARISIERFGLLPRS